MVYVKYTLLALICTLLVNLLGTRSRPASFHGVVSFAASNAVLYLTSLAIVIDQYGFQWSGHGILNQFVLLPIRGMLVGMWVFQPAFALGVCIGVALSQFLPKRNQDSKTSRFTVRLSTLLFSFSMLIVVIGAVTFELRARSRQKTQKDSSILRFELLNLRDFEIETLQTVGPRISQRAGEGIVHRIEVRCELSIYSRDLLLSQYEWKTAVEVGPANQNAFTPGARILTSEEFNNTFLSNPKYRFGTAWFDEEASVLFCEATSVSCN